MLGNRPQSGEVRQKTLQRKCLTRIRRGPAQGVSGFSPIAGRWALIALAVVVGASSPEARDRTESDRSWKASWEARQAREAERRRVEQLRWAHEFRRGLAHARMRSEPDGGAMRASTPPVAEAMCPVLSDPAARQEYQRQARQWREQAFRRSTGLQPRTGLSVFSASRAVTQLSPEAFPRPWPRPRTRSPTAFLTSDASASSLTGSSRMVPLFPSASDARGRQGFARVINHSEEAGEVKIEAFDDEGMSYGPLTLSIDAGETVHFNSNDVEQGNANKGLTGNTGSGQGDWRLEFSSALDIEMLSYIRTTDGFLTAMHDTVAEEEGRHEAAIFNPGSNQNQESLLRLVNPGDEAAEVTITAVDDRGSSPGGGVTVTLPAGSSVTYTAAELESGSATGLEGSIGDGSGKWRLLIESESDIVAMSLLSSPTGHLTNLSTAPDNEQDGTHAVPLFPSSSDARGRQGFARVANRSDESGEVTIEAFDDTDREYEVVTLSIGANETRHFNSDDLELGNADKGLVGSTGAGEGDWRLELESALDIEVLSYIRTTDGFLTAMHDVVPRSAKRHRVAVFNPGSNLNQQSLLRLVNPGKEEAEVMIVGFDDRDASPGRDVVVSVPAGSSRTLTAAELEAGGEFEGALGDGAGKWRLTVNADRAISAMSLLSSPTGHLTNLSTAPERGAGPVETAAEAHEALISPIVQSKCVNCHVEGGASGHTPLVFVRATDADHLAKNLKAFEDYLAEVDDGAERILNKIQGALAHGGGVQVSAGTEEYAGFERFMGLLGADVDPSGETLDLFEGVRFESPRRTLWRAAIVFAGRVPTAAEYAMVEGGAEDDLRRAIRSLMECPEDKPRRRCGFHEFLIRGANDRLLTDREARLTIDNDSHFVSFTNKHFRLQEVIEQSDSEEDREIMAEWILGVQYGAARAPLELIAHVAEEDLPYTEIMTADYVMANPWSAEAYESPTVFNDPADVHEFRPSEILGYYRKGEGFVDRYVLGIGPIVDEYPESLRVGDYPHAGILNTKAFLQRYPTTVTNVNRARSRWTYYHFLGFDVEKSKLRTMVPAVLKDTNNPTMHNPACTGCHERLDPVAGAFQNYGDVGNYRDQWGGRDSLDEYYKEGRRYAREFTISALTREHRQTVSSSGYLPAGANGGVGLKVILGPDHAHDGWTPHLGVDRLTIRDPIGSWEQRYELEELFAGRHDGDACGHPISSTGSDQFDSYRLWECLLRVPVEVPASGDYVVEVETWILDDLGRDPTATATLRLSTPYLYQDGDNWYRNMREPGLVREPGFVVEAVPEDNADNSLQWLGQRIVEDERFADSAVKFWWPAIMGSELAERPEETDDADYEGRKIAADAQHEEVRRLAVGFTRGFNWSGKGPYNLKDLLVEIVMSPWFRATGIDHVDPVRYEALRHAGARRLLTPEELARKTHALTGFRWITGRPDVDRPPHAHGWSGLTDPNYGYGLLYGGIDSDGVTIRARDMTPVMAGVSLSHALESSCPIVLRDLFLLPDEHRKLFRGIDASTTPASEFGGKFDVSASSREEIGTYSVGGALAAGRVTVLLAFLNDHEDDAGNNRDLLLDTLTVTRERVVVEEYEMKNHEHEVDCHHIEQDAFHLSVSGAGCVLSVPLEIAQDGEYEIMVTAWAEQAGDEPARLEVAVESNTVSSSGAHAIRTKLAELHEKLFGVAVGVDSMRVSTAYRRFVEIWNEKRTRGGHFVRNDGSLHCDWQTDAYYFDGLADDLWNEEKRVVDIEGAQEYLDQVDLSDPSGAARTWVTVLAFLLTDYLYLYL